jgi:hypothetical protein
MKFIQAMVVTLALTGAMVAEAHEGHGVVEPGNSLRHYLTEPLHVVPLLLVAAFVVLLVRALRRGKKNRNRHTD